FFQAEDGIRDDLVTGVQTCALPICRRAGMLVRLNVPSVNQIGALTSRGTVTIGGSTAISGLDTTFSGWGCPPAGTGVAGAAVPKIGRASCRERGWRW